MNRAGTSANLVPGDSNPLRADEVDQIVSAYQRGDKLRVIGCAISRPLGTVKTAVSRLQAVGIVGRRYQARADG
jgi:hypothetical protein